MPQITRSLRQWRATAGHLGSSPTAAIITAAVRRDGFASYDELLAIDLSEAQAREIEERAPMSAWWMPATPGSTVIAAEATATAAVADAFVRALGRGSSR